MIDEQIKRDVMTGIELIDRQHQTIIDIIEEIEEANIEGSLPRLVEPILNKLEGYTQYHFATEEALFAKFKYEDAVEHVEEHQRAAAQVKQMLEAVKKDPRQVATDLTVFLAGWLVNHVRDMDSRYVVCFREHGM